MPSKEEDSAAAASAGAEAAGPELGLGPPGGTAECWERLWLGGSTKRLQVVQRIQRSPGKASKPCGGGQEHRPMAPSRAPWFIFAHSPGCARSKSSTAGSAVDASADTRCWEWIGGVERSAAPCATKAGASTKPPAETQGGEGPAASSAEPEQTSGQAAGRPEGGGAGRGRGKDAGPERTGMADPSGKVTVLGLVAAAGEEAETAAEDPESRGGEVEEGECRQAKGTARDCETGCVPEMRSRLRRAAPGLQGAAKSADRLGAPQRAQASGWS